MENLKVGPGNHEAIASIASSLRRRAEQVEPAYSTQQIIAACFPGTIVTGRRLPAGFKDVVRIDDAAFRSHRAPHLIVYSRGLTVPEQRHAISHAIAHVIFDGARNAGCHPHDTAREQRCDLFADELLVPLDELRPYVCLWPTTDPEEHETYLDQVDQVASHFNVTPSVIDRRIRAMRGRDLVDVIF